jgi:hypothetical protein
MHIEKLQIQQTHFDNNFLLYLFLKEMNSTNGLKPEEIEKLLSIYYVKKNAKKEIIYNEIVDSFYAYMGNIKNADKKENMHKLLLYINSSEILQIYIFALQLMVIKPMLLCESKIYNTLKAINKSSDNLLSVKYDDSGKHSAYYTRVNGALLSLLFFNKLENKSINILSEDARSYLEYVLDNYHSLKGTGIEPNQMFMLMFTESVNQSIKSDAGTSYEERILQVLQDIGIDKSLIEKTHDEEDRLIEYDFLIKLNSRIIGISAKRTLRERWKQFTKTATSSADIMITITLGLDLTEDKAKIIRQNNVYIFVADEIYQSRLFLQHTEGIYPASSLSLDLLKSFK